MPLTLENLIREATQLPERDRATLAGLLIESLDPSADAETEAAWAKEIERRVAEVDAGSVELVPWETLRAELLSRRDDRQVPSGGA